MASDLEGASQAASPRRRARRRRRLFIPLAIFACAAAILLGLALIDAGRAAREVRAGRAAFTRLFDEGLFAQGELAPSASNGARHFDAAANLVKNSRWLDAWARVPALGRPARWLKSATRTTATLARQAAVSVTRIEPGLDTLADPKARLLFLARLERELKTLRSAVASIRLPPAGGFLPPVDAAERELTKDISRLRRALDDGVVALNGLQSFLGGPSTYAILAANNAEMRAGGMVLQVGVLEASGGSIRSAGFRSTGDLTLRKPVPLPEEFQALYGWLAPDIEWRNVGSSPNFPAVAPVYAAMAERSGLGRVDGALQIDVAGLRALLQVVGPVSVAGTQFRPDNVERLIMHDLYARYRGSQPERRQELSRLAGATIQALNERRWEPTLLLRALRSATRGRHLIAWSRRPIEQESWRRLGIDGSLDRDGLMLTVQNHTGNKLDWFLRTSMDLRVERRRGAWRRVHLSIRIVNPTPRGEPRYIAGDGSLVPPGAHRALVAVYLPGWATNVEMPGRKVVLVGPDGPSRVIGTRLDIARGSSAEIEIVFSIPPEMHRMVLLPSARAAPVTVVIGGLRLKDDVRRSLRL